MLYSKNMNSGNRKIILIVFALIVLGVIVLGLSKLNPKEKDSKPSKAVKASHKELKPISENERNEYQLKTNFIEEYGEAPFNVYSDGAVVINADNGQIYYQKNPDMKLPTASISKIMTATIALEYGEKEKLINISKNASEQIPNKLQMDEGEKLKLDDLLYALMMLSANDAAFAIAEGTLGLDEFVKAMNEKAGWLELKNSNFQNPAGFDDPNHKSTAYDLGVITRYVIKKYPEILKYMGTLDYSVPETSHNKPHYMYHLSGLLKSYPGMDGAKTGYTWEAGHTFIGTAKKENTRLIVVVLNSQDSGYDIRTLLDYGFRSANKPF